MASGSWSARSPATPIRFHADADRASPARPPVRVRAVILRSTPRASGPGNTMSIGPGPASRVGRELRRTVAAWRRQSAKSALQADAPRFDVEVPGLRAGQRGRHFSCFRRRGAPSRQPALTQAEEIDLATWAARSTAPTSILLAGGAQHKTRSKQPTPPRPARSAAPRHHATARPRPGQRAEAPAARDFCSAAATAAPPGRNGAAPARARGRAHRSWCGKTSSAARWSEGVASMCAGGAVGLPGPTVPARRRCST